MLKNGEDGILSIFQMDFNLDGVVDDQDQATDDMQEVYDEYFRIIKEEEAPRYNREDDFFIINNGYLLPEYNYPNLNGKRYEDFNGNFQGTYREAAEQYARSYTDPDFLEDPVFSLISERDRCYYKGYECGEYHYNPNLTVNENNNFQKHRDILALVLAIGDGSYGHDHGHATGIPACAHTARDDFFDEFVVDGNGVSAKHPEHDAPDVCFSVHNVTICEKDRAVHKGWMGKAIDVGYEVDTSVYRRDFENAIALVNIGFEEKTIDLGGTYYRIIGVDPVDSSDIGNIFNDGSAHTSVVLGPTEGAIFLNFEPRLP